MGNIAVFGGTFNPIHSEHIKIIEFVSKLCFIDKVIVMPTHIPPHKETKNLASDNDRFNMCKIAVEDIEKVIVSDFEINRQGKSYSFYTFEALKKEYEKDELFLVCGGDMAITLDTWYNFDGLKKLCTFLVINRPGTDKDELNTYLDKLTKEGAKVIVLDCVTADVSSTAERKSRNMHNVTAKVYDYIKEKGLYKND